MALTLTLVDQNTNRGIRHRWWDVQFDSSYPTGGEALTAASLGLRVVHAVSASPEGGVVFEYDHSNSKLAARTGSASGSSIEVVDDDNAASTGVALYVHIDEVLEQGGYLAHLEAVTAGNADSYFAIRDGGPQVRVQDDDNAASTGLALYIDEDAATPDARFLADLDNVGDADVFVMTSNGELIRINDTDTPGTPGVQVYFDDDAANDYERLLFVSPTDTDATAKTDDSLSFAAGGEVSNLVDLSGLTTRVYAVGK